MSGIDLRWCFWAYLAWLWPFTWLAAAAEAATPVDGQKQPRSLIWADFAFFLPALVRFRIRPLALLMFGHSWLGYMATSLAGCGVTARGGARAAYLLHLRISAWL